MALPHRVRAYLRHRRGRDPRSCQRRCHHELNQRNLSGKRGKQCPKPTVEEETTVQHTEPAPPPEASRLLSLPPELRNRIYELVLIENGDIDVVTSLKHPGLPDTCRQIRQEALQLWYSDNTFLFKVDNCDGVLAIMFHRHACVTPVVECQMRSRLWYTGLPDWKNLMQWAKLHWDDERRSNMTITLDAAIDTQHSGMVHMATAVHGVVDEMIERPWEEVSSVIEGMRTAVRPYTTVWDATAE